MPGVSGTQTATALGIPGRGPLPGSPAAPSTTAAGGAVVSNLRPELDTSVILSGVPIRSDTWQTLGGLANWISGHGQMIVPWCFPGHTVTSGSTDTFRFYVKPKAQALQRVWLLNLRGATSASRASVVAPSGGTLVDRAIATSRDRSVPIAFTQLVTSSTASGEITIDVRATGGDVVVDSLACYEQTRAELHLDTTDNGVALATIRARQPIIDLANRSLAGICDAYDALDARRSSLLQWSVPSADAAFTASGAYQAVFEGAPMVVGPIIDSTSTTVGYSVWAYVRATGGSIFVQATSTAGSVNNNTASTTFVWLSVGTLSVAVEQLSDADGLPAVGWDTCTIEIKCGTGTKAEIAGVSVLRETLPL